MPAGVALKDEGGREESAQWFSSSGEADGGKWKLES